MLPRLLRRPLQYANEVLQAHGDCVRLDLGLGRVHLLGHPDHAEHVLRDNSDNYDKGDMYRPFRRVFGAGMGTSEGELWRQKRRTLQPMFNRQRLAALTPLTIAAIEDSQDRWPAPRRDQPFEVAAAMNGLAMRVILRTMFSADLTETEIDRLGAAVRTIIDHIGLGMWTAFLPSWVPVPGDARAARAIQTVDEAIFRLIDQRRRAGSEPSGDLLSLLLQARDTETGQPLDDRQVRDEAVSFFIAGSESTATALTWSLFLLCRHPEVERSLRTELDAVVGRRTPVEADIARLTYTRMVFQEAMRLYPPLWLIPRRAKQDDTIGGYHIPAGSAVLVLTRAIHHHGAFWTDPEAFRPERFDPASSAGRHRYAYIPFGAGPRQCIASGLGMVEGTLALAMIAQRYRMRLVPGHPVEPKASLTLHPHRGVLVTLEAT